jgi:cation diffusion facilitator CzcD-associated flavoprotein CzcO
MVDEVAYKKRKLKVATIGAGFSGLMFAHKIQHERPELQEFIDHTIYEANDDIGGTWKNNTYPGVQCDVPSHIYVSLIDHNTVQFLIPPGVSIRP